MPKKAPKKEQKIEEKKIENGSLVKDVGLNGNNKASASYSAKDIYVLEGLEPVRKRPGMYIGSTGVDGLHHLIWEVVDNSLDEAMAGFCKNIRVELLPDNVVSITDDGRGIPVDIHPQTKKSALETALSTLHAGGKFGGESYKVSGGLHGVGVSVVNALSTWLKAEINKDGGVYIQEYKRGEPQYKVKKVGTAKTTGTKITFQPDSQIFQKIEFNRAKILEHLRQQAFLTKGVRIEVLDHTSKPPFYHAFYFEGGLLSFIQYLNQSNESIQKEIFYAHKEYEEIEVEVAFTFNKNIETQELSFANNIYTPDGGMHLTGFRTALTRTLNDYARSNNYLKNADENLIGDDVREGLVAIVSVKLREPQFEGQTKARLGNPPARSAVEAVVAETLKEYLEKNGNDGRSIIEKCLITQKARKAAKAAKDTVLRKGALEGMTLPGKLADCSSRDPEDSELFIVEGDSAGGCFSGDTKIALTDGRNLSFKDLVEEDRQGKKNYCYTVKSDGSIAVEEIKSPRLTKKSAEVIKIVFDNDEEIISTPDHKFMLRDGLYKEAHYLTPQDSLMPLRRKYSEIGGKITIAGYEMIFSSKGNHWIFTHLLADRYNIIKGIYPEDAGTHKHHKDFNKLNNNPDNIERMTRDGHLLYHSQLLEKTLHREDVKKKSREIHQSEEYRKKIQEIMTTPEMRRMLSERAKKQWQSEEYKTYMTQKFLEFYNSNADYREKNNRLLNKEQKKYWSSNENKDRQARRVQEYFEAHPEKRELLSGIARKQWADSVLREWRAEATKKQWTSDFRKKRNISYNETYLRKALEALYGLYSKNKSISEEEYNRIRKIKKDKSLIRYDTVRQRFFDGNEEKLKEAVVNFNHRIKAVFPLREKIDVYDLEVSGTHNFALASGVFVHNSAKSARDRRYQAILPLRGKILNVEKSRIDKMLLNKEIRSLVIAIGTAIGAEFDITKIRYHKIIIATDADTDGAHIRTLLLPLFYRYFAEVIEKGFLYIAQPPLYRLQRGKEVRYAYNENEKDKVLAQISKAPIAKRKADEAKEDESEEITEGSGEKKSGVNIQRYKGLGEMNPDQLWETTMDQNNRVLKLVMVTDAKEAERLFDILMGESVEPRKHFIQSQATMVKNLDI